jgi:hypothetical protein
LLTATPLQNSLLELYGLVSFVDERVFGDLESFRAQFGQLKDAASFDALKNRIHRSASAPCADRLRPTSNTPDAFRCCKSLYPASTKPISTTTYRNSCNARPSTHLPNSQRQLITLVLRKLLASSTFAIAGALETLIKRLRQTLDQKAGKHRPRRRA